MAMRNSCTSPRDPVTFDAMMLVGGSNKVFQFPHQFDEHHSIDFVEDLRRKRRAEKT
jgi:hypothetical protein